MCEPTTIAALSIASTAASTYAQGQQAESQGIAASQQHAARREESGAALTVEVGRRAREARASRARQRVAAGEAGVSGGSFEASIRNSLAQQSRNESTLRLQGRFGARADAARFRSTTAGIESPNLALAGLQIAGAVQDYRNS